MIDFLKKNMALYVVITIVILFVGASIYSVREQTKNMEATLEIR